jgi:hypothetical protein
MNKDSTYDLLGIGEQAMFTEGTGGGSMNGSSSIDGTSIFS